MNRERTEATMNDREALAAALERIENEVALWGEIDGSRDPFMADIKINAAAARERLAQLPPYSDELLERIGRGMAQGLLDFANALNLNGMWTKEQNNRLVVAVLDALNGLVPEETA